MNSIYEVKTQKYAMILGTIIMAIIITMCILCEQKKPKEAHAQEITYTIERGMYTFNESIVFETQQIPVQAGETHIIGKNDNIIRIVFNPVFENVQVTPEEGITTPESKGDANGIDIWVKTQKIQVIYPYIADNGQQSGNVATDIYTNQMGWMYNLYTGTAGNQTLHKIQIPTYTVIVKNDIQVGNYEYWFWNANTTRVGAQNQQTGNITDYNTGYQAGYEQGQIDKVQNDYGTYESAFNAGQTAGYNEGYKAGYQAINAENPYTFDNLLMAVIRAPSEFYKSFWNTEILGINLAGIVGTMLTICLIFAVFKVIKRFI